MFRIINEPPWWGLFFVVVAFFGDIGQLVITIFSIGMHYTLARIFGKSKLFSVLTGLFPYVFIPIIALGGSLYQGGDYENINTEDTTNLSNLTALTHLDLSNSKILEQITDNELPNSLETLKIGSSLFTDTIDQYQEKKFNSFNHNRIKNSKIN